jgi:hypothetical protein
MHADRGAAVNLMLYGLEALWVCADSRQLTVAEMAAVVEWEHAQAVISTDAEAAERVDRLRELVVAKKAVYFVKQRPEELVTVPAGVLHAVYTTTCPSSHGACKFAFDYPPTTDLAAYYSDMRKLALVASRLSAHNLAGWGQRSGDCVNVDGWLLAAIQSTVLGDGSS